MKGDINIMKFRMKKITALMAAAVLYETIQNSLPEFKKLAAEYELGK